MPIENISLRLPKDLYDLVQQISKARGQSMNKLICTATAAAVSIDADVATIDSRSLTPASEDQLIDILATSVADHLRNERGWAKDIIRQAQLRWPGGVLQTRMAHYASEKRLLAKKFSAWLGRRISHFLDSEHINVSLMIDAGSSNLWFSRFLWNHLAKISTMPRQTTSLTLITNSVPVAENFAEQCELKRFGSGTRIECVLLGGNMQSQYGALVGAVTQKSLTEATGAKENQRYISLSSGNFVRLEKERSCYPVPLIRGEGQKEVKDLYIERAHEVFMFMPLGKIFLKDTAEINEALHLGHSEDTHKQPYNDVRVDPQQQEKVKVVTTSRTWQHAILGRHSSAVNALLGIDPSSAEADVTAAIKDIHHFCYEYDEHIEGKSFEEQVKIEFPHEDTQAPDFMKNFFQVQPH